MSHELSHHPLHPQSSQPPDLMPLSPPKNEIARVVYAVVDVFFIIKLLPGIVKFKIACFVTAWLTTALSCIDKYRPWFYFPNGRDK